MQDKAHEVGKYKYANGTIYHGEFAHDKHSGHGTLVLKNQVVSGEWKNDNLHGNVTQDKNHQSTWIGEYIDDKMNGFFEVYYPDGSLQIDGFVTD